MCTYGVCVLLLDFWSAAALAAAAAAAVAAAVAALFGAGSKLAKDMFTRLWL